MDEEIKAEIASRIKKIRKSKKLSAAKMAEILYINPRTYGAYERNEIAIPLELIYAMYKNFKTDPLWLIFGIERKESDIAKILEKIEKIEKTICPETPFERH